MPFNPSLPATGSAISSAELREQFIALNEKIEAGPGNTVIVEGDARLTNSRSPTAHASTHRAGGSDPLGGLWAFKRKIGTQFPGGTTLTPIEELDFALLGGNTYLFKSQIFYTTPDNTGLRLGLMGLNNLYRFHVQIWNAVASGIGTGGIISNVGGGTDYVDYEALNCISVATIEGIITTDADTTLTPAFCQTSTGSNCHVRGNSYAGVCEL